MEEFSEPKGTQKICIGSCSSLILSVIFLWKFFSKERIISLDESDLTRFKSKKILYKIDKVEEAHGSPGQDRVMIVLQDKPVIA